MADRKLVKQRRGGLAFPAEIVEGGVEPNAALFRKTIEFYDETEFQAAAYVGRR